MRYRITVNQAALQAQAPNVIHVHDSVSDTRVDCEQVVMMGWSRVVYDPDGGLADGSRVWIETDIEPQVVRSLN